MAPRSPSLETVSELAERHGFDLTPEEIATYRDVMAHTLEVLGRLDELPPAPRPEVRYPRTPGYRPGPEENRYGAWYWRCSIDGAPDGPLAGKTVAIKDSICVAGVPMMNGSSLLEGFVPEVDATVVTRILDAGGQIVGKAACEHLCVSDSSNTSDCGPVLNPYDTARSAGGSSSGSAVAVATGDCDLALGADQAGSIRMPAAWCGIYGLKPSYGLVPYTGCASIEYTLDHVGPMAASVRDIALLLGAIAGPDDFDPRQAGVVADDYLAQLDAGIEGMRVGVLEEGFGWPGAEEEVESAVRSAADRLRELGATVEAVSVPLHRDSAAIWRGIGVEGNLLRQFRGSLVATGSRAWYDVALHDAFGRARARNANDLAHTAKSIALSGAYLHERYGGRFYAKARNLVPLLTRAYDDALAQHDVLLMPATPMRPTLLPGPEASLADLIRHAFEVNASVCGFNLTGHPGISIPIGPSGGLPIGLMAIGGRFADAQLLRFAQACEQSIATPVVAPAG